MITFFSRVSEPAAHTIRSGGGRVAMGFAAARFPAAVRVGDEDQNVGVLLDRLLRRVAPHHDWQGPPWCGTRAGALSGTSELSPSW